MPDPFVIAPLQVGHATVALCPLPGRTGDYDGDIAQILEFAPDLVLSMTEVEERNALGAADFPARMAASGIEWLGFPVPDYGTPDPAADWASLSTKAQAVLANGGRILAHCRGGLGRSGMVVLRLMIEQGEDPETAFARLRAVRPGAVETDAQNLWARSPKRTAE